MARPRSDAARAKVLEAAAELALDVGIRAFTIDELARRSGVAKTTIYRHFAGRNEIVITALDQLTPVPDVPDTGSLRTDLVEFLCNVLPIFEDRKLRALFLDVFAAASLDPDLASMQATMLQGRAEALNTVLDRALERGELATPLDRALAFELIEGPLIVRSLGLTESLADIDLDAIVERALTVLNA